MIELMLIINYRPGRYVGRLQIFGRETHTGRLLPGALSRTRIRAK